MELLQLHPATTRRPRLLLFLFTFLHLLHWFSLCIGQSVLDLNSDGDSHLPFCRNTIQGRFLISDERGYVCHIKVVEPLTGCCPVSGEQFPCLGCNLTSQCCDSYEYCVSCCLSPNRTSSDLVTKVKVAQQVSAGTYNSMFDFCLGRCRHNSGSVVHENAYINEEHHCFSLILNSSVEQPKVDEEADLTGISIVIGRQGQSCEAACKLKGQSCKLKKLVTINKCNALRKYFTCKGSCTASIGADQPAEVSASAPRHLHPGACMFNTQERLLSCEGSHPHTRRLCPCS